MQWQFLASGRVRDLPSHEMRADGRVRGLLAGQVHGVTVRRKTFVAAALNTPVPATRPPGYVVEAGVRCIPPGDLPRVLSPLDGWVVVGSGWTRRWSPPSAAAPPSRAPSWRCCAA